MKKLLFGVDDTQECKRAIDTIVYFFGHREIELTLLHATPDIIVYNQSGVMDYGAIESMENQKAAEMLKEFQDIFAKNGIATKTLLKTGNPIDIVLDIAKEYDLLVIGASESSLLHRIFNSHQASFINLSPIPVLVAK